MLRLRRPRPHRTGRIVQDALMGARFFRRLPRHLRHRLTLDEARATLRRRLQHRERDFLSLVQHAVFLHPPSPYLELLEWAGCEYGDLERLVVQDGVESALRQLLRSGVYLTVDEFKGRKPAVRGSTEIAVDPARCRNPLSESHVAVGTSGSRGPGTAVTLDLAFVRECAVDTLLALHARGAADCVKAHWQVPGGGALGRLVEFSSFGKPCAAWFSQVDPGAPELQARYRWSASAMRWASLLAGTPLPRPRHVPLEDPGPILRWMEEALRVGARPHLFSFASSAVRLCRAATESGMELDGAHFTVVGEPFTDARARVIRETGAEVAPRYAIIECSAVGHGCLDPERADEVHLLHDLHVAVQCEAGDAASGLVPGSLLLSSVRASAPFLLLNVSMGDQAIVTERSCGCPLERLGWRTHLHTIRSREKLTAGGMTLLDHDVIPILEEVLPARFGGGPTDFQLLEEEDADGRSLLRLLAHPALGALDAQALRDAFLTAIGGRGGTEQVMASMWRESGMLRVERRPPVTTATGKVLHLHVPACAEHTRRDASSA